MQHHEKNTQRVSEKDFLHHRLMEPIRCLPNYKPVQQFGRLHVQSTLCRLAVLDVHAFSYEAICSMLQSALDALTHYNAVQSVAESAPRTMNGRLQMMIELIRFFEWMSILGIRADKLVGIDPDEFQ